MKITKELKSDLIHISANLYSFTDKQLGKFMRQILDREIFRAKGFEQESPRGDDYDHHLEDGE